MIIPHLELSPEALQGIIEDYVTRDGTDYGAVETPLQHKVDQVKRQLEKGNYFILYDMELQTTVIVSKDQLPDKLRAEN
ncbi:MAG: YheU family protein [Proteobacteria bacterium]|nr:YheU family protein [Pseudomonadota bacterium]